MSVTLSQCESRFFRMEWRGTIKIVHTEAHYLILLYNTRVPALLPALTFDQIDYENEKCPQEVTEQWTWKKITSILILITFLLEVEIM